MGIHVEVTTLVIPKENDSTQELTDIATFLAGVSPNIVWHLSAYHDDYNFQGRGKTPVKTLENAAAIGKKCGLKYCYMGNVHSDIDTKCPKCGARLIDRQWGAAKVLAINGKCKCGEVIPGVFDGVRNLPPKILKVPE